MLNTKFSPWPSFSEREAQAVYEVVRSNRVNYWTGTECRTFEEEFARWIGVDYAIALTNGTAALELALKALGIGVGDEVIVTPRTFIASISCVVAMGAVPVFAEIDPDSQNMTAESIQAVLTPRTKAVVCVHLAGWPCEMDSIMALARQHDFFVIEDCAQAHGAQYKGRAVGSIGHVGAWSFCQDKIMTTGGEGGMVTTNDPELWARMWSYKDHGKTTDILSNARPSQPGFRWVHESFGTNFRMTEMQAVIGRIQLELMEAWHATRVRYAKAIWECASALPGLHVPVLPSHIQHAAYKCYVFLVPEQLAHGWDQARVIAAINEQGVPCYSGSCSEVYLEKAFDGTGFRPENRLPVAQQLGQTSLMFLVHPTLTEAEIDKTCEVLKQVMQQAVGS